MSRLLVPIEERDLRAGVRVLRSLLHSDHPMVQRVVTEALVGYGKHEALGCVAKMEGALLEEEASKR